MEREMVTIKTSKEAREMLRILAAKQGKKQYEVLENLLAKALNEQAG